MDMFKERKEVFKKTLEKIIDLKYITVNEYISIDGMAAMFANDLWSMEDKIKTTN